VVPYHAEQHYLTNLTSVAMVGKTGGEEESQLLVKSQASCLFYN